MIKNQLKIGVMLNYATIALNAIVGLLYTPYMLRMMGQSEYGLYALVASVIGYLTVLDLGFGNAIVRYTSKLKAEGKMKEQSEMFGMFILLYIGISIFVIFAGMYLLSNIEIIFGGSMTDDEISKARIMMILLIANLAYTFPMTIWGSIIYAYEHFVFQKSINILRILLNTVVMVVLLSIGYKAIAMVIVQTVFNVITLFFNYLYCKKKLKIGVVYGVFNWTLLKEIAIYSSWIFIMIIVDKLYWNTGQFVLGSLLGTSAVAILAVAIQLYMMYQEFSCAVSTIYLPKITSLVANNVANEEISNLFVKNGRLQFAVLSLILTGFVIFGRQFVYLWAGEGYENVYSMCLLFFIPAIIPLTQNIGIVILQARNQMKFRSLCYICIASASILIQILLVKKMGIMGSPIAICIATLLGQILIMNIYYNWGQHISIIKYWKEILKMSIIPALFSMFGLLILAQTNQIRSWDRLLLYICFFCMLYIPSAFIFQLNALERNQIKKIISKRV